MTDDALKDLLKNLELLPAMAKRLEAMRPESEAEKGLASDGKVSPPAAKPPIWPEIDPLLYVHVTPQDIVFDIGANVGKHSQIFAGIGARTHAFEPNPQLAEKLRQKFQNTSVTIHEVALSDTVGEATFYLDTRPEMPAVASSLRLLADLHAAGKTEAINVKTDTLDEVVRKTGDHPTFIKIDVEGHEPAVFAGGRQTIETYRPRIIFELWGSHFARFEGTFDWLHPMYHLVRVSDGIDAYDFYKTKADPKGCDIIALPRPGIV